MAFVVGSVASATAAESRYTPTNGPDCKDGSREHFSMRRCPGLAGYTVEYSDEGNLAGMAIWKEGRGTNDRPAIVWRGSGSVFGKHLEWRLHGGVPKAAIVRIWRTETSADGRERQIEELMLIRLEPSGSCRVTAVDARQPAANELARSQADSSMLACGKEQP